MKILDTTSLVKTVDNINEALFWGKPIPKVERKKAAEWLAGRHMLARGYWGLFAPTKKDYLQGVVVFTGEPVKSRAASAHIAGEEAARALRLINVPGPVVRSALTRAEKPLLDLFAKDQGVHCCGFCTASLWRNLAAGGFNNQKVRLGNGINDLARSRIGKGNWKRYPFYYTILTLLEIENQPAKEELQYAAPRMERLYKRVSGKGAIEQRRKAVLERALGRC